jgi:DnaJ-class molecular chaperone
MFDSFDKIVKNFKKFNTASEKWEQDLQDNFTKEINKTFPKPPVGGNLRYDLKIGWEDAIRGCEKEIRISRLELTAEGDLKQVIRMLKITIPKDEKHKNILIAKGHGNACKHGGKPGDLFVLLLIPEQGNKRSYNDINNDIFTNFKVASENFNRDLSKILLLDRNIQQIVKGDTFGEDLRLDLTIGFDDAIRGCEREIKIPRLGMTEKGELAQVIKSLKVNIPADTNHGNKLRLKGQGDACKHGGKPGDLYLCLLVASSDKEQKRNDVNIDPEIEIDKSHSRGEDLHVDLVIGFNDAILGCVRNMDISRLELNAQGELERVVSSLKFTIPADTNHGSQLRLKGQGDACRHGGEPGGLYLYIMVKSPEKARSPERESKHNDVSIESKIETNGLHFRDKDLQLDMAIGFDEAILGCERELQVPRLEMIEEGELEHIIKTLKVTIPAGTNHGSTLRLKRQGNACRYGGEPGDLYLYLFVALQDKERKRNGANIESEIKITSSQASAGGEIVVNTTTGWRTIFVSPGTKTGDFLVLSGCGVYQSANPSKNGDYIIKFNCE